MPKAMNMKSPKKLRVRKLRENEVPVEGEQDPMKKKKLQESARLSGERRPKEQGDTSGKGDQIKNPMAGVKTVLDVEDAIKHMEKLLKEGKKKDVPLIEDDVEDELEDELENDIDSDIESDVDGELNPDTDIAFDGEDEEEGFGEGGEFGGEGEGEGFEDDNVETIDLNQGKPVKNVQVIVTFDEKEEEDLLAGDDEAADKEVDGLIAAEGLDPSVKERTKACFKTAVKEAVDRRAALLSKKASKKLAEAILKHSKLMEAKLDRYATFAAKKFVAENKIAIQNDLRTELMESFVGGLRDLFLEHNIFVPAGKENLVTKLDSAVKTLQEQVKMERERSKRYLGEARKLRRERVLKEACEGLTAPQQDRLTKLSEEIEFKNTENFKFKVNELKTKYVLGSTQQEPKKQVNESKNNDPEVARVLAVLNGRH